MTNKEIMYHALTQYANDQWQQAIMLYDSAILASENGDDAEHDRKVRLADEVESLGTRASKLSEKYQ